MKTINLKKDAYLVADPEKEIVFELPKVKESGPHIEPINVGLGNKGCFRWGMNRLYWESEK